MLKKVDPNLPRINNYNADPPCLVSAGKYGNTVAQNKEGLITLIILEGLNVLKFGVILLVSGKYAALPIIEKLISHLA